VAEHVAALDASSARAIGDAAARRVLRDHTYAQRAELVDRVLRAHVLHSGAPA